MPVGVTDPDEVELMEGVLLGDDVPKGDAVLDSEGVEEDVCEGVQVRVSPELTVCDGLPEEVRVYVAL